MTDKKQGLLKPFGAAILAAGLALQATTASATVAETDVSDLTADEQYIVAAGQSTDRVSVLVRSEDLLFREAVRDAVLYVEQTYRQRTGQDIEIGITYGTDTDDDPSSYEVEILADGLPSDFGFIIHNFSGDEHGVRAVMLDVAQQTWAAHQTHIAPFQTASADPN